VCSQPNTLLVNVTLLETDSTDVSSGNRPQLRTDIRMHANHRDMGGSTTSRCKLPIHCRVAIAVPSRARCTWLCRLPFRRLPLIYSVSSPDLEILTSFVGLSRPSVCKRVRDSDAPQSKTKTHAQKRKKEVGMPSSIQPSTDLPSAHGTLSLSLSLSLPLSSKQSEGRKSIREISLGAGPLRRHKSLCSTSMRHL